VDGSAAALEAIIAWSQQGPPAARVDHVAIEEAASNSEAFTILPTL
jgi:acylphosphatase